MHCYLCHHNKLKLITGHPWPIKECLNCGLIQVLPLPSLQQVATLYQGDYWSALCQFGQPQAHRQYFRKKMTAIKMRSPDGKLLDVGCALGVFLAEAGKHGYAAYGIDISPEAVSYCLSQGLKAKVVKMENLDINNDYQVVTAFEVIEHSPNPLGMLKAIHKRLVKNGLLVVTVPNTDSLFSRLMGKYWFGYQNKEHLFHFNRQSLALILKKSGFRQITVNKDKDYRSYLLTHYARRLNFYLFKSTVADKIISFMEKAPFVNTVTVPFNPWENLIAYAIK